MTAADDIFASVDDEFADFDAYHYALKKHGYRLSEPKHFASGTIFIKINDNVALRYEKRRQRFTLLSHKGHKKKFVRAKVKLVNSPLHMLRVLSDWQVEIHFD